MKILIKLLILPLFLICIPNINSLDNGTDISAIEVQGFYRGEYLRSHNFLNEISAIGIIELKSNLAFKGGISVGRTITDTEINTLVGINYSPFSFPLSFNASYVYNGFPEYKAHMHSIIPFISYNTNRAGISLGSNFRFSNYFGGDAQFESILSFYAYWNFIYNDVLCAGIGAGNMNYFKAKNMGAFSLNFNASVQLNDNWKIINEIEWMQSGVDGLTATLYGMAFRTGVKYSW